MGFQTGCRGDRQVCGLMEPETSIMLAPVRRLASLRKTCVIGELQRGTPRPNANCPI